MGFIATFLSNLDRYLASYVLDIFNILAPEIRMLWLSMATLLIVFVGIRMMTRGDVHAGDFLISLFKIVIILALTTQWGNFSTFVYEVFTNLPTEIGELTLNAADGSAPTTISAQLGDHYERLKDVANNVLAGASWMDVGKFVLYLLLTIAAGLMCFLGVGFISLAKVATAVMLAVAPIFILLLMFRQSSTLFEGWLKALLNYSLLPLFVYMILGLALTLGDSVLTTLEVSSTGDFAGLLEASINYLLFSFVSFILLIQAPTIAANVGGGFALSSMNALHRMNVMRRPVQRKAGEYGSKSAHASKRMVRHSIAKARSFQR
jgi:type IV secretion system protein VirB6